MAAEVDNKVKIAFFMHKVFKKLTLIGVFIGIGRFLIFIVLFCSLAMKLNSEDSAQAVEGCAVPVEQELSCPKDMRDVESSALDGIQRDESLKQGSWAFAKSVGLNERMNNGLLRLNRDVERLKEVNAKHDEALASTDADFRDSTFEVIDMLSKFGWKDIHSKFNENENLVLTDPNISKEEKELRKNKRQFILYSLVSAFPDQWEKVSKSKSNTPFVDLISEASSVLIEKSPELKGKSLEEMLPFIFQEIKVSHERLNKIAKESMAEFSTLEKIETFHSYVNQAQAAIKAKASKDKVKEEAVEYAGGDFKDFFNHSVLKVHQAVFSDLISTESSFSLDMFDADKDRVSKDRANGLQYRHNSSYRQSMMQGARFPGSRAPTNEHGIPQEDIDAEAQLVVNFKLRSWESFLNLNFGGDVTKIQPAEATNIVLNQCLGDSSVKVKETKLKARSAFCNELKDYMKNRALLYDSYKGTLGITKDDFLRRSKSEILTVAFAKYLTSLIKAKKNVSKDYGTNGIDANNVLSNIDQVNGNIDKLLKALKANGSDSVLAEIEKANRERNKDKADKSTHLRTYVESLIGPVTKENNEEARKILDKILPIDFKEHFLKGYSHEGAAYAEERLLLTECYSEKLARCLQKKMDAFDASAPQLRDATQKKIIQHPDEATYSKWEEECVRGLGFSSPKLVSAAKAEAMEDVLKFMQIRETRESLKQGFDLVKAVPSLENKTNPFEIHLDNNKMNPSFNVRGLEGTSTSDSDPEKSKKIIDFLSVFEDLVSKKKATPDELLINSGARGGITIHTKGPDSKSKSMTADPPTIEMGTTQEIPKVDLHLRDKSIPSLQMFLLDHAKNVDTSYDGSVYDQFNNMKKWYEDTRTLKLKTDEAYKKMPDPMLVGNTVFIPKFGMHNTPVIDVLSVDQWITNMQSQLTTVLNKIQPTLDKFQVAAPVTLQGSDRLTGALFLSMVSLLKVGNYVTPSDVYDKAFPELNTWGGLWNEFKTKGTTARREMTQAFHDFEATSNELRLDLLRMKNENGFRGPVADQITRSLVDNNNIFDFWNSREADMKKSYNDILDKGGKADAKLALQIAVLLALRKLEPFMSGVVGRCMVFSRFKLLPHLMRTRALTDPVRQASLLRSMAASSNGAMARAAQRVLSNTNPASLTAANRALLQANAKAIYQGHMQTFVNTSVNAGKMGWWLIHFVMPLAHHGLDVSNNAIHGFEKPSKFYDNKGNFPLLTDRALDSLLAANISLNLKTDKEDKLEKRADGTEVSGDQLADYDWIKFAQAIGLDLFQTATTPIIGHYSEKAMVGMKGYMNGSAVRTVQKGQVVSSAVQNSGKIRDALRRFQALGKTKAKSVLGSDPISTAANWGVGLPWTIITNKIQQSDTGQQIFGEYVKDALAQSLKKVTAELDSTQEQLDRVKANVSNYKKEHGDTDIPAHLKKGLTDLEEKVVALKQTKENLQHPDLLTSGVNFVKTYASDLIFNTYMSANFTKDNPPPTVDNARVSIANKALAESFITRQQTGNVNNIRETTYQVGNGQTLDGYEVILTQDSYRTLGAYQEALKSMHFKKVPDQSAVDLAAVRVGTNRGTGEITVFIPKDLVQPPSGMRNFLRSKLFGKTELECLQKWWSMYAESALNPALVE